MLYSCLKQSVNISPDAIVFYSDNYKCTYIELDEKVTILSNGLLQKGLKKGDRLASYLLNCPEGIYLYFACFKIGVSVVIIHPSFRDFEIRLLIENTQPKLLITQLELYKNIQEFVNEFSSLKDYCYLIDCSHNENSNILPFTDLLDKTYQTENLIEEISGEQEAIIYLTSGSTGRSKCVQSNHKQYFSYLETYKTFQFNYNDKFLLISPINSLTGLILGILPAVRYGSIFYYLSTNLPSKQYMKMIPPILYEQKITYFFCISSTLRNLIEEIEQYTEKQYRKNFLRYCFVGGEKFSKLSAEKSRKYLGIYPHEVYGLTETSGPVAISADYPPICGRFKRLNETIKFRITNDNWEDMPYNTSGEITIYSDTIMTGYVNDQEATQKIIKNGWMKTGDIGYLESDDILNVVGRLKQIIICNGCNINLLELEETIRECNDVYEVCATSIPYMESEKPVIYVTFHSSHSINIVEDEEYLFSYLKGRVADFKIPLYIRILDVLPKNIIGKIDRKMLSEKALKEFTQHEI
ncbi:unnamed protein product [Adineta steineri]|uniref:AMP-dependent synthetase/ligase domain-containing protein n=1 Tax=Adineta steineri TaxID=433720 RepID=A0A819TW89_9BILA|nr:unnamed protein product [Adineta steineri]